MFDFDKEIKRKGTNCSKWGHQGGDFIPMWVADMDFPLVPPIMDAIQRRLSHPVFGYGGYPEEAAEAVIRHYQEAYGAAVSRDWLVWVPSVMPGANLACRAGGGDMVYNTPMYTHIRRLPKEAGVNAVEVPMREEGLHYTLDFEAMEQAITPDVKVFVNCNPHNPVGRVMTRSELEEIDGFAHRHSLLVVSDEIHCELILEGRHIPYFTLNERAEQTSITLSSAGKIANIPGLPLAFAIIPNKELSKSFQEEACGLFSHPNELAVAAISAAYDGSCKEWKDRLIDYLRQNRNYLEERIRKIPRLHAVHNEATYLCWIDARESGIHDPYTFFRDKAGVRLNDGRDYGKEGFVRLNFGCPRKQLTEALDRMEEAVRKNC